MQGVGTIRDQIALNRLFDTSRSGKYTVDVKFTDDESRIATLHTLPLRSLSSNARRRRKLHSTVHADYYQHLGGRQSVTITETAYRVCGAELEGSHNYVEVRDDSGGLLPPLKNRADSIIECSGRGCSCPARRNC
jgi:hypothetical protein